MSDEQQVNQAERDVIGNYNAARHRRTGALIGNDIDDRLREHEERVVAEDTETHEEDQS